MYYLFKKLFRLSLEIAPLYKKQNRLILKTSFLINGFLLYSETLNVNLADF